jgi:hypothetical protein
MVKIRMIKDAEHSLDGVTVTNFIAGEEYEVPSNVFESFYADGIADKINPTQNEVAKVKAIDEVVEVKAIEAAPENKSKGK